MVLITVDWNGAPSASYHLENIAPGSQKLKLDAGFPSGIVVEDGKGRHLCPLFDPGSGGTLEQAKASKSIFTPLCENRFYLRSSAKGEHTALEAGTEFLRNKVWGGEEMIDIFHHLLENAHRETGKVHTQANPSSDTQFASGPLPALVDSAYTGQVIASENLGIMPEILRKMVCARASGMPRVGIGRLCKFASAEFYRLPDSWQLQGKSE